MSQLLDHPVPTLPPPPPRRHRLPDWLRLSPRARRVVFVIVGALIIFGVWLFYFSSVFALQSVVVEGVKLVSAAEVGQRADMGAGTPLARINPEDIEARVMGIPAVRSVEVTRRWPNTVVIQVQERREVGYLTEDVAIGESSSAEATSGQVAETQGQVGSESEVAPTQDAVPQAPTQTIYKIVDDTGYAFRQVENLEDVPRGLPQIEATSPAGQTAAGEVAGALPERVLAQIATITADDPNKIILTTKGQATIIWGPSVENDLKARVLQALLKRTDDLWLDLRSPGFPTTAYQSPQPAAPSPTASASSDTGESSSGELQPTPSSAPSAGEVAVVPSLPGVIPSTLPPQVGD